MPEHRTAPHRPKTNSVQENRVLEILRKFWCVVQSGANWSVAKPSLIWGIFQGILEFWVPELLLLLLGNDGFRPLDTQIC